MILVHCPLMQKEMQEAIEAFEIEGNKVFTFIKKEKIRMYFESTLDNDETSCRIISKIIQNHKYGPALMYNVVSSDGNKIKWF